MSRIATGRIRSPEPALFATVGAEGWARRIVDGRPLAVEVFRYPGAAGGEALFALYCWGYDAAAGDEAVMDRDLQDCGDYDFVTGSPGSVAGALQEAAKEMLESLGFVRAKLNHQPVVFRQAGWLPESAAQVYRSYED